MKKPVIGITCGIEVCVGTGLVKRSEIPLLRGPCPYPDFASGGTGFLMKNNRWQMTNKNFENLNKD